MTYEIKQGNALDVLKTLESESVQCCVTSPPYFGLRDYGVAGQIGLEDTPAAFVASLIAVFEEVRRVLKSDGICWLNLGDSYWGSGKGLNPDGTHSSLNSPTDKQFTNAGSLKTKVGKYRDDLGLKSKDLIGVPWRVAFALQEAGWWLRQDIIWNKPNPMPESVTDRCTKSHEYIFLLTKSAKYYYNGEAIRERLKDASIARLGQDLEGQEGSDRVPGKTNGKMKAVIFGGNNRCPDTRLQSGKEWNPKGRDRSNGNRNGAGLSTLDHKNVKDKGQQPHSMHLSRLTGASDAEYFDGDGTANKKSVWTVTTQPFKAAHFATFPEKLIIPCILAGSREGDLVLDPFNGAGTTGLVALKNKRRYVGIELNPEYIEITKKRLKEVQVKLF